MRLSRFELETDWYCVLGVPPNADAPTIRRIYRKQVLTSHPDLNSDDDASHRRLADLNAAVHILLNDDRRAAYDQHRLSALPGATRSTRAASPERTKSRTPDWVAPESPAAPAASDSRELDDLLRDVPGRVSVGLTRWLAAQPQQHKLWAVSIAITLALVLFAASAMQPKPLSPLSPTQAAALIID